MNNTARRILAIESSAKAASVAVMCGDRLEAYAYQNTGLTHSRTLMPMVRDALKNAGRVLGEIDLVAAAVGPGSFTGVRIGAAAAKGIAWAADKPCVGVSTLDAMARCVSHMRGILCCVMDARRGEVYNAVFKSDGTTPERLCEDRAISAEMLKTELGRYSETVVLMGDGAEMCYDILRDGCPSLVLAPPHLRYQSAYGVALAAVHTLEQQPALGETRELSSLNPVYIRMSQAERERLERERNNNE